MDAGRGVDHQLGAAHASVHARDTTHVETHRLRRGEGEDGRKREQSCDHFSGRRGDCVECTVAMRGKRNREFAERGDGKRARAEKLIGATSQQKSFGIPSTVTSTRHHPSPVLPLRFRACSLAVFPQTRFQQHRFRFPQYQLGVHSTSHRVTSRALRGRFVRNRQSEIICATNRSVSLNSHLLQQ